ncbi:Hypothetical protein R9X50_00348300 [Acrodontium crateriforme]|uniref:Serine hydrolase domain-containing protein n=1 Tax=Acrodontium crateriforme TaxID=150365 RepID=A0AAQ3M5U3_9PEZI|nr:Hypothetical protein R9X50_00348300 [Acrodontium crateriforme]
MCIYWGPRQCGAADHIPPQCPRRHHVFCNTHRRLWLKVQAVVSSIICKMKILCLHGRGSNNEIFQAQTAAFRADLEDFEFVFIQGTVRHTEGNWSLYTSSFSDSPLYTYYNPFDPTSILQTDTELEDIIAKEGPFDGVLGYSGGAAVAAEIIARNALSDPFAIERPFRFAIFINGASPLRVFTLDEVEIQDGEIDAGPLTAQAEAMFLRPSALRKKDGVSEEDQIDHAKLLGLLARLKGKRMKDGTVFLTDGKYGLCRFESNASEDGPLIDIPTLHIRSTDEDELDPHHGLHLLGLCDKEQAKEYHHAYGHDFPRGRTDMKQISALIREVAESA